MSNYAGTYAAYYDYRATGLEGDVQFYVYFIHEELDEAGGVLSKAYAPLTLRYVFRWEMQ